MKIRELLEQGITNTKYKNHIDCLFRALDGEGKEITLCRHSFPPYMPPDLWEERPERHGMLNWQVVSDNAVYDLTNVPTTITRGDGKVGVVTFKRGEGNDGFLGAFSLTHEGKFVYLSNVWCKEGQDPHDVFREALGSLLYDFLIVI